MSTLPSSVRRIVLAFLMVLLVAIPVRAQQVVSPDDLVRVRILSAETRRMEIVQGVVQQIDSDSLLLVRQSDGAPPERISTWDIVAIDRSVRDGTHARRAGFIGFLGLGTATAVVSYATYEDVPCDPFSFCLQPSRRFVTVTGFVVGGLLGIIPGRMIGARKQRSIWESARLPGDAAGARVGLRVSPRSGVGLRITY